MSLPRYRIEVSPTGYQSLNAIKGRKLLREIVKTIDALTQSPDRKGKLLRAPLDGVYSLRAARDRLRVLYRVNPRQKLVSVLLVAARAPGTEEDVYALAKKLLATFLKKEHE